MKFPYMFNLVNINIQNSKNKNENTDKESKIMVDYQVDILILNIMNA